MIWEHHCGELTVYAIEDGFFLRDPLEMMPGSDPEFWARHPEYLLDGDLRISLGCFLVTGPGGPVLVDTGNGPPTESTPPSFTTGRLLEALGRLDIAPNDVAAVLHTHLHGDHWGWDAAEDGSRRFGNARYWVHRRELDHWVADDGPRGAAVRDRFVPLVESGAVELVEGDHEPVAGFAMSERFGHTPGHMSVVLTSGDERTVVTGDAAHHPAQVTHPDWNIFADTDLEQAATTRAALFREVADSSTVLAGGHFPRPGFGRVVTDTVRRWMPVSVKEH